MGGTGPLSTELQTHVRREQRAKRAFPQDILIRSNTGGTGVLCPTHGGRLQVCASILSVRGVRGGADGTRVLLEKKQRHRVEDGTSEESILIHV